MFLDRCLRGDAGDDSALVEIVEVPQTLDVEIDDRDLRAHADGDSSCRAADRSRAQDDHLGWLDAGDAA